MLQSQELFSSLFLSSLQFCCRRKINLFQPNVNDIIAFLTEICNLGYISVCMRRTTLNTIVTLPGFPTISGYSLIKRFIKSAFNKNNQTQDTSTLWTYLKYCHTLQALDAIKHCLIRITKTFRIVTLGHTN